MKFMIFGREYGLSVNYLKAIRNIPNNNKTIIILEFYEPLVEELENLLKDECDDFYYNELLNGDVIINFRFILPKDDEIIKVINRILKSLTYALIYHNSENEFISLFCNIMLKYVETGELKW